MLRLLADEDFNFDIVRAHDVDLARTPHREILAWAMAGMFFVRQHGAIIDDLVHLDTCSETAEWANQFIYLPLR